jgi:DNA-binding CsgD family transcriptional regulator
LSTYRSKSEPELRVAGQDEPIPIVELPPALDEAEASSSQPTESRALALEELLTRREAEIARFVAEGLSNKQIARKATISEATVKITQGLQKARHRKSQHARRYGQLGAGAWTRTVMRPFRRSVVSTLEGAGFASGPWHIRCGHG